ncbi:Uncharacterized protein Rs2_50641 [Raphanus sativus]|nr:Uncharacterized protein Rs2_50641 [Raphanus sativus]
MAESLSQSGAQLVAHQAESDLASLVFDMSQQVQVGMENMLKLVNEIDGNSVGIKEEIEKSKGFCDGEEEGSRGRERTVSESCLHYSRHAQQPSLKIAAAAGGMHPSRRVETFIR